MENKDKLAGSAIFFFGTITPILRFLEDVTTSIEEVLDESRKKYKLREEVILGISGVLVPLVNFHNNYFEHCF